MHTALDRMAVPDHLERFCGPIVEGWHCDADGRRLPFQIVRLAGGPVANTTTFSTLGLGDRPLRSKNSEKYIRHELVMLARSGQVPPILPAILQQAASEALERGFAYLRGELIGPRGSMFGSLGMTALYAALPVYFPDDFASVRLSDGVDVVFAWLVPITQQEAELVTRCGWERLEEALVKNDPDLLDFARASAQGIQ